MRAPRTRLVLALALATACSPPAVDDDPADTTVGDDTETSGETDEVPAGAWCPAVEGVVASCAPGLTIDRFWADIVPHPDQMPPLYTGNAADLVWEGVYGAAEDFDQDGDLDILVGGSPGELTMWVREPQGFVPQPVVADFPITWVEGIVADDFDGDGYPEAILTAAHDLDRKLLRKILEIVDTGAFDPENFERPAFEFVMVHREPDGTFVATKGIEHGLDQSCEVLDLRVADLDGDGLLEILMLSEYSGCEDRAFKQVSPGEWEPMGSLLPAEFTANALAAIADVDEDGRPEIYAGSYQGAGERASRVWIHGDDGWSDLRRSPFTQTDGRSIMGGAFLDADVDGTPELYVANLGRQHLLRFSPGEVIGTDIAAAAHCNLLATTDGLNYPIGWASAGVDLDGDRDPEIVSATGLERLDENWAQQFIWFWNQGVDGDGIPQFERDLSRDVVIDTQERGLLVADFNGDGWPDVFPLPIVGKTSRVLIPPKVEGRTMGFARVVYPTGQAAPGTRVVAVYDDGTRVAHVAWGNGGLLGSSPVGVWLARDGLVRLETKAMTSTAVATIEADDVGDRIVVEP